METLNHVKRGEQKLYCFIEVCDSLFPSVSRSTVRLWLKNVQIQTIYPTLDEKRVFKDRNPKIKCSVFDLISEGGLERLLARENDKRRPEKLVNYSDDSADEIDGPQLAVATPEKLCLPPSTPAGQATPSTPASTSSCQTPTDGVSESLSPADQTSEEAVTPGKKKGCRTPYALSIQEAGDYVNCEVDALRKFYKIESNAKRNGPPFAQATIDKLVERIYCFLHFCSRTKNIPVVHLGLFNDDTLICEYVEFLPKVRKLMPNTITAHLTAIINVIKYNSREDWSAYDQCTAILSCRSFQRQFSRQAKLISRRSKEGICMKKSSQQFFFNPILDTIRNFEAKIYETSGVQKARHFHDFVMLAMYLRVNPGRSKEISTLQVFVESDDNSFDPTSFIHTNVIVFRKDKRVSLVENDFKTVQSACPRNINLSDDQDLVYYLNQYNTARASLLQAKSHAHFFLSCSGEPFNLNCSGEPFKDSASLCKYLGDLIGREVSIRVSTNALKHSIVTYFNTLEDYKNYTAWKNYTALSRFANNSFPKHQNLRLRAGVVHLKFQQ